MKRSEVFLGEARRNMRVVKYVLLINAESRERKYLYASIVSG